MGLNSQGLPYFYIREEKSNARGIRVHISPDIPRDKKLYNENFYNIREGSILKVDKSDTAVFSDLMTSVYPLVSEKFMKLLHLYNIEIFSKRVALIETESRKVLTYYLLYTGGYYKKSINKDLRIENKGDDIGFIISLDFAESLIRRNVKGIEFIEAEEE
jgi:hypothetical protein